MTEKEIIEFRVKAISYFIPILRKEGYTDENNQVSDLAFFIAKILEDAYPLIKNVNENNPQIDEVIDNIHSLYTNVAAFEQGKRLLMWEELTWE